MNAAADEDGDGDGDEDGAEPDPGPSGASAQPDPAPGASPHVLDPGTGCLRRALRGVLSVCCRHGPCREVSAGNPEPYPREGEPGSAVSWRGEPGGRAFAGEGAR